jgi:hypothetical protein
MLLLYREALIAAMGMTRALHRNSDYLTVAAVRIDTLVIGDPIVKEANDGLIIEGWTDGSRTYITNAQTLSL